MDHSSLARRITLLCLVGLAFSVVLILHHTKVKYGFQDSPSACSINSYVDCDQVAKTEFSELFGLIPTASLGFFFYLLLLGVVQLVAYKTELDIRPTVFVLALGGMLATLIMVFLSFVIVQKFCLYCSALWLTNLMILLVAWKNRGEGSFSGCCISGLAEMLNLMLPKFISFSKKSWAGNLFLYTVIAASLSWAIPGAYVFQIIFPENLRLKLGSYHRTESIFLQRSTNSLAGAVDAWRRTAPQKISITETGPNRDFIMGQSNAPITIVEFGDYECPMCKQAAKDLKEFAKQYAGKVRIIYKNYPLDNSCNSEISRPMHKHSCKASLMARCAGMVSDELYWQMHESLYQLNNWSDEQLRSVADNLGLTEANFWQCVESPETLARLKEDISLGQKLGVTGTPSVFVNGIRIKGSYHDMLPLIVDELTGKVR